MKTSIIQTYTDTPQIKNYGQQQLSGTTTALPNKGKRPNILDEIENRSSPSHICSFPPRFLKLTLAIINCLSIPTVS